MSSLIKRNLLPSCGEGEEYLIEPEKGLHRGHHSRKIKGATAEDAARSIIAQAQEESEALVLMATEESESIRETAYHEGYEAGMHQLDADRLELAENFSSLESEVERQVARFWINIEPELLKLSVEIAGKVVRQKIDENEELVLTTVKAGLKQLRDRQELKIHVNPDDYRLLRERREDVQSSCDGIRSVEVIDDRRVEKGGCLIESGNGHLDGRIETQLGEVEHTLLEAVRYGESEISAES